MTILFKDDFSSTEREGDTLTGWGAGFIHSPETIDFVYDPTNPSNRVLRVTKGGTGEDNELEIAQSRNEMEFWTRTKVYFPPNFALTASSQWFNFVDAMFEYDDATHTLVCPLMVYDNNPMRLIANVWSYEGGTVTMDNETAVGINVPRGQWVVFVTHIIRDKISGLIEHYIGYGHDPVTFTKFWTFNGKTKLNEDEFNWIPIKHYCDSRESSKVVLYDDVMFATTQAEVFGSTSPPPPPPSPVFYPCPFCDAEFSSESELGAHIIEMHPTEPPPQTFPCPFCDLVFSTESELGAHILAVHPTETPSPVVTSNFLYWSLLGAFGILSIVLLANLGKKKDE